MGRKFKAESSVQSFQEDFDVPGLCDDRNLHGTYRASISHTLTAWTGLLDDDKVDEMIVRALVGALESATWIVTDVKTRFTLPPGWTSDEGKWDLYRKAIAVTLLQAYYDALP